MKDITILFTTLLLSGFVTAQDQLVEDVVLQGKFLKSDVQKSNFNITIISKEQIENTPAQTVEDLLQFHSGMDIRRRGANGVQTDVSIRGGTFEQVLILLNGIRMNDAQTGHNSMNIPVDLTAVERIEIVKGPAARRYGQGAYAGVVNIITKVSGEERVKISLDGGDFGTYALGTTATFGSNKIKNLFQVNRSVSDGYRYNTDSELINFFYQTDVPLKNGSIGFQGGFSEKKFGANGFYASPLATEQYEEMQASVVALKYQQRFNRWTLNSNIFWRRGQDMYLYNRYNPSIYRNMHIGNSYGLEANSTYQSSMGLTGFGVEFRREGLVSSNLGNRNRKVSQFFLEHHFTFLKDALKITPGISWANHEGIGNFFYPGVDVGYTVDDHHRFFGNIGRVNRLPTFTDLYYTSLTEKGNPNLTPENGWSSEIGYHHKRKNSTITVSAFLKNSENAIDWTKNSVSDLWQAYNVGKITTKGFEIDFAQQIPSLKTQLSGSYTYMQNDYRANSPFSRYLIDNLKHQIIGKMQNKIGKWFVNEISYRYLQRVNSTSYQLLDEKLSFRYNHFESYILINNITNTKYTEAFGVPMPGRWFHLGLSYTIR